MPMIGISSFRKRVTGSVQPTFHRTDRAVESHRGVDISQVKNIDGKQNFPVVRGQKR